MSVLNTKIRGAQIAAAVAGDGLEKDGSDNFQLDLKVSAGLEIDTGELAINLDGSTLTIGASGVKLADLLDGKILVGNVSNVATGVTMSGDVTISNAGVATIGATKVTDSMINDDVATGLAGTGITASGGVLSVDSITDNIVESDIKLEDESANCNGSEEVFSLDSVPVANSLQVFLNGLLQQNGSGKDYTITGAAITFATAPASGDILLVHFIVNN